MTKTTKTTNTENISSVETSTDRHAAFDNYLAIQLQKLSILIPSHQVLSLESATDIIAEQAMDESGKPINTSSVGSLEFGAQRCPVFALDDELHPQAFQAEIKTVVLLRDSTAFGLCAHDVNLIPGYTLRFERVPECMVKSRQFFHYLAIHNGTASCYFEVREIARLLQPSRLSRSAAA